MKFDRRSHQCREIHVAAEFYHRARLAGLDVHMECRLPSLVHRSGEMRVDAIVVDGDDIVCCVEVKREGRIALGGRQANAYWNLERDYGIPTVWINSVSGLDKAIADIRGFLDRRRAA